MHDVRRLLKSLLHVAEIKQTVPIPVRAHFRMEKALILQSVFRGHHRRKRVVVDFHKFRGIFGDHARLCDHSSDGLTLIDDFVDGHRIVGDFLPDVRADLNEGFHHALHVSTSQSANDSG